jgi:NitT/TauT family transport system permease protein/taurine transport system permease protein
MNPALAAWGAYMRWTDRVPAVRALVPFIPIVALWAIVAETEVFPRVFFPGPAEVVRSFLTLTYKGILPAYLEDSLVRLAVGALAGMALGIPLGILVGLSATAHRVLWPVLLFFQAIGDIAWLPILLIWFGFGLTTMTFIIVYTVLFPVVLNTVLGVRSVPVDMHRAAQSLGASRARILWRWCCRGVAQHHHGPAQRPRLRLARPDRGRDDRRHERHRLHDVRRPPLRIRGRDHARHDRAGLLWYVVDAWILAPIERATGQRWGMVTP